MFGGVIEGFTCPLWASSNTLLDKLHVPRGTGGLPGPRAGIWDKLLSRTPQLRKTRMCSFRPGVHIFWHLGCLHWRSVFLLSLFFSLPPSPRYGLSFSMKSPSLLPPSVVLFYRVFPLLVSTGNSSQTTLSLSLSSTNTCSGRVYHSHNAGWKVQHNTRHLASRHGVERPDIIPTECRALLIACGDCQGYLQGLFRPDLIITRADTVTRGWAGREGVSLPTVLGQHLWLWSPRGRFLFFCFFFPHNGF